MRYASALRPPALVLAVAFATLACASDSRDEGPQVPCTHVAWVQAPGAASVVVRPGWVGYAATPMQRVGGGWWTATLVPPAGPQTYALDVDGTPALDPTVPTSAFATIDGASREVVWIDVASCEAPALRVEALEASAALAARVTFLSARDGSPPRDASATLDGVPTTAALEGRTITVAAPVTVGRHKLRATATDAAGRTAAVERSFFAGPPFSWNDAVVYQVMVDRYRDAGGGALAALKEPSARAGGHLDGVRRALGDIAALGANTLWISPVYPAPPGTFPGRDGRPYSGYHGYWPVAARDVEPAFGGPAALEALVAEAHAKNLRVVLDVVPNHVHEQHPYVAAHRDWFDATACLCGDAACPWNAGVLPCRFAPYLPDVEFRNPAALDAMVDDVRWAVDRFSLDGVRIDAVPQMPRATSRRIVHALGRLDPSLLTLGETFVGPGGYPGLRHFLGPGGLSSEFEFPLMWALRATFAERTASLAALGDAVLASRDALADTGAVMSTMIGNHDVPRFVSLAVGDGGLDGFVTAPQPTDADPYLRAALAFGVVFALPGMPTVYYGDEVGLAGGGDPDTRRPFPAEVALLPPQRDLRARIRRFAAARACHPALRGSAVSVVASDPERLVLARASGGRTVLVVVTRDDRARLEGPLPAGIAPGPWVDLLSGEKKSLAARAVWDEPARSVRYYAQDGDPCVGKASGV